MMIKIDYKKELENAAKGMIMVHDPGILIKMIVRMMVRRVGVKHAGILLYNKEKDIYVLSVSRGKKGLKIPVGYARLDSHSALIRFFSEGKNKLISKQGVLALRQIKKILKQRSIFKKHPGLKESLLACVGQMEIFGAVACIPSHLPFRSAKEQQENLVGVLLLGEKEYGGKIHPEELDFFIALSSDVAMALHNAQLFNDLQKELDRERRLFFHTTIALAAAIDAKDHYTHGHTERVTSYSMAIAEEISCLGKMTFDDKFKQNLHVAALLHDIGKIGVPEQVLNKPSELTEEEYKTIKEHPLVGANIIKPIRELAGCAPGVKHHHERIDGKGYPEGLQGEQIPLIARIIGVADAFDAIMTDRPYRRALPIAAAVKKLIDGKGTQFDALITDAFVSYLIRSGKLKKGSIKGCKILAPKVCPPVKTLTAIPPGEAFTRVAKQFHKERKYRPRGRPAKRWF